MDDIATIFVVDDDASLRTALERLITSVGLRCETFSTAEDYLRKARKDVPGCILLDVKMPGHSGLDLQRALGAAGFRRPIIFLTAHGDISLSVRAMKAGATEFLTKPFQERELLEAIRQAIQRDRNTREQHADRQQLLERYNTLTARERKVMTCVVAGLLNKQTAERLVISASTVKAHRAEVMRKMQAGSVADLVRMARFIGVTHDAGE